MNAFKKMVGAEEPQQQQGVLDDLDRACTLSKKNRIIGFSICFGTGFLISFLSMMSLANPTRFALLYSLGNVISLLSTGFLVGPKKQIMTACARKRALATIIFFAAIAGTLWAAL
jgi:hypothetical protein